ncbi:hypothetical protein DFJ73DRAFT_873975 [Zopfochytrium polystomum]|nr:hypothetical protein DFJ73DRAFT_873975 [Zopfochytrium polystomum]
MLWTSATQLALRTWLAYGMLYLLERCAARVLSWLTFKLHDLRSSNSASCEIPAAVHASRTSSADMVAMRPPLSAPNPLSPEPAQF